LRDQICCFIRAGADTLFQITLYEILIGRTPFEENEEEEFQDPDTYLIYYERSRKGEWLGKWSMPDGESLIFNDLIPCHILCLRPYLLDPVISRLLPSLALFTSRTTHIHSFSPLSTSVACCDLLRASLTYRPSTPDPFNGLP
jgi:hypothetical protein